MTAWLRFFRLVNLPTVPGDVLVGLAAVLPLLADPVSPRTAVCAVLASMAAYLFGLADNDIVGATTDTDRPIPSGEISLAAARVARGFCWGAVMVFGALGDLPPVWWIVALLLMTAVILYNRTKNAGLMGVCRGLNLLTGTAAVWTAGLSPVVPLALALVWTLYIGGVTRYSEGEEQDEAKRRTVGFLIGALVYLQLGALTVLALLHPEIPAYRPILLSGAALLVALRVLRKALPKVSAS